jgi:predicted nucleotide-binding protein
MDILTTLKGLIETGEKLAPQGGMLIDGYNGELQPEYISWKLQAILAIQELGECAKPILRDIEADKHGNFFYQESAARILGGLRAALAVAERKYGTPQPNLGAKADAPNKKVFVVHGHDESLLNQVARFLENLELEPVILFEQPGKGRTIIEELEQNAEVNFAVVLLTPDDLGKAVDSPSDYKRRARQNVIFELGYFVGKYGRERVAVLYDEKVELPSDYHGIEYIEIDKHGAWKLKLAKELKSSGLSIDMNRFI